VGNACVITITPASFRVVLHSKTLYQMLSTLLPRLHNTTFWVPQISDNMAELHFVRGPVQTFLVTILQYL